jgi:tripartite-type tricarboxylate transporter receptor subunit TctC
LLALLAAALVGPQHAPAAEHGYPNHPVRIIVPYGPGGVADTTMRIIADKLTQKFGQQFIIDNRPGAGGIVAAKAAAGAAPDGYLLHLTGTVLPSRPRCSSNFPTTCCAISRRSQLRRSST